MASRSKKYYDKNPKAKAKKAAYDKEYNKKTVDDRSSRNAARRKVKKKSGSIPKGMDVHHKNGNPKDNDLGNLIVISLSKNRGMKKACKRKKN
jgi:hypothetical protein